ncbi:MAG: hypothetical protein KIPDCIKN_01574 [Haliscomenobacter sp.]|jgi:acetoin utilization protein AcuB|nr:hypothetical protein [Haliscomenobacter sp.]
MTAEQLVSQSIIPLQTSDTGEVALEMMAELGVRHLPIVNNMQLLGVISEEDVLNFDVTEAVGSYGLSLPKPYVKKADHILEVMRLQMELELSLIPVVDEDHNYLGSISIDRLLAQFSRLAAISEPGSILVLDLNKRDYSLAEIARIVESENMAILSSFVTTYPDSSRIDVTLKLNSQNTLSLLATFERFKYEVKASYLETDFVDSMKERYDALISYLNI